MPKMKTHKGAVKRIKITGSGKVMRRSKTRGKEAKRRKKGVYNTEVQLSNHNKRALKRMVPNIS